MKKSSLFLGLVFIFQLAFSQQTPFRLNKLEYFERGGVNVWLSRISIPKATREVLP
jgi:hypothetical protein